jgi:peptidyl-prolyl cis-trans isomerase A (cyclophilin A)
MQLFINKKDNKYLDKEGFAPFGLVIEGMEFVDLINDEYKEKPNQGKIQNQGNVYLNHDFPNLSYVASIREITPDANDAASVPKVVSPS